jgi:hypothetical protein
MGWAKAGSVTLGLAAALLAGLLAVGAAVAARHSAANQSSPPGCCH